MLKKSLLTLALFTVAAYLAATWYVGSRIEALLADNDSKMATQLRFLKISDRKFERGLFQSVETAKISLNLPNRQNIQFTLKSTIRNGPVPDFSNIAAAVVDSELSLNEGYQQDLLNWLSTAAIFTSHTTYMLNGMEGESRIIFTPSNATNLDWDGITMKVNFSNDLMHYSILADMPRLYLHFNGIDLKVAGLHYDADQRQVFNDDPTLYAGSHKLSLSQVEVNSTNPAVAFLPSSIVAKDLSMADNASLAGNEFLDFFAKSSSQTFEINSQNYGPAHFDVSLHHLHARTFADLVRKNQENSGQAPSTTVSPQMLAQRQELIRQGAELLIDRLSFSTPQGEASLSSSIRLSDAMQVDLADRNALMKNLNFKMQVALPEDFAKSLQGKFGNTTQTEDHTSAVIQDAVNHGYVVRNGNMLQSRIEFKNSQLSLNDILFVPTQLQPATMSSGTEMPLLARALNCTACHSIERKVVGPAWRDVARRYKGITYFEYNGINYPLVDGLVMKVSRGGAGHWGAMPMPPIDPPGRKTAEITNLVQYILNIDTLSGSNASAPTPASVPTFASTSVPAYQLNEPLNEYMAKLGNPVTSGVSINPHTRSADHEQTMLAFRGRGITLFFRNDNHLLEIVRLDAPYADKVRGVKIGDSSSLMLSLLGSPARPPWQFANNRAYLFKDGNYSTRYDVRDGTIQTIFLFNR